MRRIQVSRETTGVDRTGACDNREQQTRVDDLLIMLDRMYSWI